MRERHVIDIGGRVQGVGFRPHVARLAARCGLDGWVANTPGGVRVDVEGARGPLVEFRRAIAREAPVRAAIEALSVAEHPAAGADDGAGARFRIAASVVGDGGAGAIAPDSATCPACLGEILDPRNRRYRYPFTSCADCGPRYGILRETPWDRANTTMAGFALCTACRAEVESAADRRFHAQTNACPDCGPRLELLDAEGEHDALGTPAFDRASDLLARGAIVALKGLGGFQLVCDATDIAAVTRLRHRKHRPHKPFAVMLAALDAVALHADTTAGERRLLAAPEAPIVLLPRVAAGPADEAGRRRQIVDAVAPGSPLLGLMLPSTPLHHLLARATDRPLVVTSGNLSGEPMAIATDDAVVRLAGIADAFLTHDRPIARALDDPLLREVAGEPLVLRLGRGLAPCHVRVDAHPVTVLGCGGDGKTGVCLVSGTDALLGEHLGDIATPRARARLLAAAAELPRLNRSTPDAIAADSHPDYVSARLARRAARERMLPFVAVPHHLAHVLAAAAEHGIDAPVLGIAWDGAGHTGDAIVRGSECLLVDRHGGSRGDTGRGNAGDGVRWRRVATLLPFPLPGGDAAAREPWRAALGACHAAVGDALFGATDAGAVDRESVAAMRAWLGRRHGPRERELLGRLLGEAGARPSVRAPLTTSAGRLFDAFASLLGLIDATSFEAQAAQALEHACLDGGGDGARGLRFVREGGGHARVKPCPLVPLDGGAGGEHAIDWRPLLARIVRARAAGLPLAALAREIHAALVDALVAVARLADVPDIVLTGGCFQNRRFAEGALMALETAGFRPRLARRVPPNDGGLALGQAIFARAALSPSALGSPADAG